MMHVSFSQKIILISLFAMLSGLAGCSPWGSPSQRKPNIIIIAVESLSFENASCLDEIVNEKDGLFELCQSALRFTHFFASSALSQSSMATLLTGLDASEHKVTHNGNTAIPVQLVTLPEKALLNGYRTAFFSGGPPFLAKSGFQQGYEVFEDGFLSGDQPYWPAKNILESANKWLNARHQPAFLTIFLADLQFPGVTTFSDDKKEREKTVLGQRQEIGESLSYFFQELKKTRHWKNSYILLVGLNGDAPLDRRGTLWRENLFRENIHVPLFVKIPGVVNKSSVDFLVSMKSVGNLVGDLIDQSRLVSDFVMQRVDEWAQAPSEFIEIRSDWSSWWFGWVPEISLRTYEYLIFPKRKMLIYDSLADKSESQPLSENQVDKEKITSIKYRYDESFDKINTTDSQLYAFIKTLRAIRLSGNADYIQALLKQPPSAYTQLLLADDALQTSDWSLLARSDKPIYQFVASKNLHTEFKNHLAGDCEKLFLNNKRESLLRRCRDVLFISLLDWEKRRSDPDYLVWEKSFMRKFRVYMQYKNLAYLNLLLELNWDVSLLDYVGPSLSELYLHLPDKAPLRKTIEKYQIPNSAGFPKIGM